MVKISDGEKHLKAKRRREDVAKYREIFHQDVDTEKSCAGELRRVDRTGRYLCLNCFELVPGERVGAYLTTHIEKLRLFPSTEEIMDEKPLGG